MGYKEIEIKVRAAANEDEIKSLVGRTAGVAKFTYNIIKKSLDARKKSDIQWLIRVGVTSPDLPKGNKPEVLTLHPEKQKRTPGKSGHKVIIVGTGPAGIFAADYLSLRGFDVTVLERGSPVENRKAALDNFEKTGTFDSKNNYSFGEGGAGTFSDGKLSSRTKNINAERNYIFQRFVETGGPEEIFYMTHPHLGSDKLFTMTKNMRKLLQDQGVKFLYETPATDLVVKNNRVTGVVTPGGILEADQVIFATGHSAFETFRMLIKNGLDFQPKNFALGFRAEHSQQIINKAQWGVPTIPGVKAAEYRLTSQTEGGIGVYSFCMCPGGMVVPAAAYGDTNIVNGMSNYSRSSPFANAAVVAGVNIQQLLGKDVNALETLHWLESLEQSFQQTPGSYKAPAMTIKDFLAGKSGSKLPASSYPLGLNPSDLGSMLPAALVKPLQEGLKDFCNKIRGYEEGILLGLESKTSAPIQVQRHPEKLWSKYENLYIAGEGSGWSGGIVSSASDGMRIAQILE